MSYKPIENTNLQNLSNTTYVPQTISFNKTSSPITKHPSITRFRKNSIMKSKLSQSSSFTSMSTTLFSKKQTETILTPKTPINLKINNINNKTIFIKKPTSKIQKQMRKVKMKIRKFIINHQQQKSCLNCDNKSQNYNDKLKEFFTSDKRIQKIKDYNSQFHFGQVHYNFIKEPLKYLIDVSKFNYKPLEIQDIFKCLTPQEKELIAIEPTYFVEGQTLLEKKLKAKSLTQKLNEEETKKNIKKNLNNNQNVKSISPLLHLGSNHSLTDIIKNYFILNEKENVTPLNSPKVTQESFINNLKLKMMDDLNTKLKQYEIDNRNNKNDDIHKINKDKVSKTIKNMKYKIYNVGIKKRRNSFQRRFGLNLRESNTRECLLKTNSNRIIFEANHKNRKEQVEIEKNNNNQMKNYLYELKKNSCKNRQEIL